MPTVDQLAPAPAATDGDELAASQSGVLRRVTRAQLLAGTQSQINVPSGTLLGRTSPSYGAPENVAVGSGLLLQAGTLSAVTKPVSLAGLDGSALSITPDGTTVSGRLSALFGPAVTPESFGAVGDGVTDDTAAFVAAVASRRPVHLGARTYALTGQWTIGASATLIGTPGQTVLKRIGQSSGSAWISINGQSFNATGIIFDANGGAVPGETWAVLVTSACLQSAFRQCCFRNASGPTLGNGLTFLASDPARSNHSIDACEANGNAAHGIWLQAIDGARLTNNRAHDNAGYGICADYNDPAFYQAVRLALVTGNECWNNARGIAIGNYNATNLQPPTWGNANPDAVGVVVSGNICHDNRVYGIAVSGRSLLVRANLLSNNGTVANGGAGILANCASSQVGGNTVVGAAQFGIDCGGSIALDVASNHISGAAVGINPGGSQGVRVASNYLQDNGWAILAYNVETDGSGNNFGLASKNLALTNNIIGISSASGGGIWLIDAPQGVLVCGNAFFGTNGAKIDQCLYAHTDNAIVENNRWNAAPRLFANPAAVNGLQTIVLPDIADDVMVSVVPAGIQSMQSQRQIDTAGQVGFVKVTSSGQGYTHATVTISGTGTGATAIAYISAGAVIGIALTNPGSGYGPTGSRATATINGDGTGATATVSVGLPVLEGRRVRIACNVASSFARAGSFPFQENWTLGSMTVPANAAITFTGTFGAWRADTSPLADYIAPPGDGSLIVRSQPGSDLALRPASSGRLRITSDADPVGYVAATGHGSPEGTVAAPPGSDYRNLDGGIGQTLWIKRTGTDVHGWYAIG